MGGGYTLSTTILHCNYWKRRGSFLGLSECRGFLEVLYSAQRVDPSIPVNCRSKYSRDHYRELSKGKAQTAWLYRRFLHDMRKDQIDESRILLCLDHSSARWVF